MVEVAADIDDVDPVVDNDTDVIYVVPVVYDPG